MAQFYTLEEAARVLGMSAEELKAKAQHREIRAFMDSGSWRFRVADVDELARRRGMGSDPDLSLSDLDLVGPESGSEGELNLSEYQLGVANPDLGPPTIAVPTSSPSEADVQFDDMSLPPPPMSMSSSSSTIIGMEPSGKLPSDSDVRLVPDNVKDASDSDVRLKESGESDVRLAGSRDSQHRPSDSDVTLVSDDEGPVSGSADQFPVAGPGDTAIRQGAQLLGSSAEVQAASEEDSDFELTPSSVIDALQPESGSDFELTALDASDEFEATPLSGSGSSPGDSDVTAAEPAASGINLGRPSDSGINLQGVGMGLGQAESIELAPLDEAEVPPPRPAPKPSPAATPVPPARGEKDIFEDTDFEVDALDTSQQDQTIQLEAAGSDYELEEADDSDSGSEVFAVDEEDVDQNAATAMAPGMLEEEEAEFAAERESDEAPSAWDVESESPEGISSAPSAAVLAPGATAEWGGAWVGVLGVATFLVLLLAFVSMDLMQNLHQYRGETFVASGLIRALSGLAGGG